MKSTNGNADNVCKSTAEAWGPGADAALAAVPALVGLGDDPAAFRPAGALLRELARRAPGLRLPKTGAVLEALVPAILEQKVTGAEAFHGFRGLVRAFGERARTACAARATAPTTPATAAR